MTSIIVFFFAESVVDVLKCSSRFFRESGEIFYVKMSIISGVLV
jgi:hypothetical protein